MNSLNVIPVKNGFLVSDEANGDMWVFANPATLAVWFENWGKEKKKEMPK